MYVLLGIVDSDLRRTWAGAGVEMSTSTFVRMAWTWTGGTSREAMPMPAMASPTGVFRGNPEAIALNASVEKMARTLKETIMYMLERLREAKGLWKSGGFVRGARGRRVTRWRC